MYVYQHNLIFDNWPLQQREILNFLYYLNTPRSSPISAVFLGRKGRVQNFKELYKYILDMVSDVSFFTTVSTIITMNEI